MTQPKMEQGTVEMVPVEWIMQNVTGSVDIYEAGPDTLYSAMMHDKVYDGIGNLVGSILERGFRIPIVLCVDYDGPGTLVHGNGHHRMCAAILLCLDQIPVYWSDRGDYMATHESEGHDDYEFPEWEDINEWEMIQELLP